MLNKVKGVVKSVFSFVPNVINEINCAIKDVLSIVRHAGNIVIHIMTSVLNTSKKIVSIVKSN